MNKRLYLDSSIFVNAFLKEEASAKRFISIIKGDGLKANMTPLTIIELVSLYRNLPEEDKEKFMKNVTEIIPKIEIKDIRISELESFEPSFVNVKMVREHHGTIVTVNPKKYKKLLKKYQLSGIKIKTPKEVLGDIQEAAVG